jgi:hypothetical protein
MIKLSKEQQNRLKAVGRKADHPNCGQPNLNRDLEIEKIKGESPHAFLNGNDLYDRFFFIKPKTINEYAGYMYENIGEIE